jgi:hypothetical protein
VEEIGTNGGAANQTFFRIICGIVKKMEIGIIGINT